MHSGGQTGEMDPNHCYWGSKLPQPSGGQFVVMIHILNMHTLCPPAILLLRIYPGEIMGQIHLSVYIWTFIIIFLLWQRLERTLISTL